MAEKKDILTRRQELAINALLTAKSIGQASRQCGISSRCLYRWLKEPVFADACREARTQAFGQGVSRLQNIMCKAVDVLEKILDTKRGRQSTKVSAARIVIENARRGQELDDMAAQLNNLERKIDDAEKKNRRPIRPL